MGWVLLALVAGFIAGVVASYSLLWWATREMFGKPFR